ncbi:MAG: hypothetical protein ACREKH_05795 [Candidatus Rokuibacteriota bacterium]
MKRSQGREWRDLSDRRWRVVPVAVIGVLTVLLAAQPVDDPAVVDLDASLTPLSYEVLEAAPP